MSLLAAPPAITAQPQRRTVIEGAGYIFTVVATGTAPLNYQWRRNASSLAGQTNSTLPLTAIQTNDAGGYSVVVTNAEGMVTSLVAQLTVRLASDPAYPTPQGGWAYLLQGNTALSVSTAALDGSWNHDNNSDSWSEDGRGPGVGLPGGVGTTNGILTLEDVITAGSSSSDNRRFYFTHDLGLDTTVTNATTLLNDGVTLTFRARLTPPGDPLIELTNAPNGFVNSGSGKGMFGIRQAGANGLLLGFSLNNPIEDTSPSSSFNFAQAGLHMNTLNGDVRSASVDPGAGTLNLLPLDPALFHEFWITIQDNGADPGTHRVSIYLDGSKTPTTFNVTAGTGYEGPATNYLALGLGSTGQRGAVDVDFLGYQSGVLLPSAFNEPVGIVLQPVTRYVVAGQIANYNVGVTGTPPCSFQWYRNGAVISGATNSNYATPPVTLGDVGAQFLVVVANDGNSVTSSPPAGLQLLSAPIITTQPASLTVTNGDPASFSVATTSAVTPTYQWRLNGGNLAGQTNTTLAIANASAANAGTYDVIVANLSGSVTSTVAVLTVILFDYGDAPDPTFPTLRASNGAGHQIVPGIFLGYTIDAEPDGQPSSGATGDDASGSDDEDGVIFVTPLLVGQTATIQVIASTNGFLNAWLDCDHNGTWTGPGEQILTNTPLVPGTNTLLLAVPAHTAPGLASARFRFNTTGGLGPTGLAADGEVEDYAPMILSVADLSITQTATPDPVAVNATLTCAITISNAGPSAAANVVTTNALPPGVNFQSVASSQGSCLLLSGTLTCDLGTISNAATATITLQFKPAAAGPLTNTVRVSSPATDLAPANNTTIVTLNALDPPTITAPPANLTITNNTPATFTVAAAGAPPLRYQWRLNGADLPLATNATLTISSAQSADAGPYTVRITNQVGVITSAAATLIVLVPPAITTAPQSQTNLAGSTVTFTAPGTGSAPLNWQWLFNNANLAGATSPTLILANLQLTNAGAYRAVLGNAAGVVTSAVANLSIIAMDFGDAPDTYHTTLAANGARHRWIPAIRLGAAIDFEPDGQPDATASGDDTAGTGDEDGITFNTPIRAGQTVSLKAVASTNGVLNAWLDYNRNGTWADPGEQIFLNRNLPAGTNTLNFTVPGNISGGPSYARFRFSTAGGLSFDGEAPSGEVEDYAVTIEAISDLAIPRLTQTNPIATGSNQTYSITVSNAGPSAATGVTLTDSLPAGVSFVAAATSLGNCTQSAGIVVCTLGTLNASNSATIQIDSIPITAGSLTNTVSVNGSQLDLNPANNTLLTVSAVQDFPMINLGPQSQIVTNGGTTSFSVTASGTALRYQWLLNGGNVSGATNAILTIVSAQPANAGSYTVRVTNDVGAALSSPATLTVIGPVSINTQPQSQSVLAGSTVAFTVLASGSPPITYQWELDGSELPGQTGASLVLGAVQTNQSGGYRVRVTNPIGSVNSAVANLTVLDLPLFLVQPQSSTNAAGSTATLASLASGTAPLGYQWFFNRTNLLAGQTNASIQFINAQANQSGAYTVLASNVAGVRTSAVAVVMVYEMDFGDAPEASGYPTTLAFNGARHRLVPGVRLGALADFETNGAPNITANGDDLAGVDDEDGVLFPATLLLGQTALVPVIASTNGFLDAWIDFNGNGSWGDPGEQVLASRPLIPGTNSIPFAISPGALPGLRYVRCRFSTAGGLPPDGFAPDGEVEDYRITLQAAVDLAVGFEDLSDPTSVSSNLLYLMTVTNRGPSTATSVMLSNQLPASYTFVQGQPSQGYCGDSGGRTVFCPVDNIPPGGVVTMLLTVRPTAVGTFLNIASASSTEAELNPADNTFTQTTSVILPPTSYTNAAALPVADATAAGPGVGNPYPSTILVSGLTTAVYRVTARLNNLSHPFSKDFDVLLVGPKGQTVLLMSDAGAGSLGGVTLTFDDAADGPLPSSGVIATGVYRPSNYGAAPDVFPTPAPAGPYSTALSAFNGSDPNGLWSLYVVDGTIAGNGSITGGWQLTLSTSDPIADLAVTSAGTPAPVPVNSNLSYAITVTNRGPAVADNAVLTNTLPPGVTFVSATTTLGSCTPQAGLVTCSFGNLNAGAGAAVTVTVRPTTVGLLTNTTRATASRLDVATANNVVQTVIPARLVTDLLVVQTASTNLVLLGEQIAYTLNVTNRGPNPATNIRLVDVLPATFNFLTASTTQGACSNLAGTITCDLGVLANNARAQIILTAAPTVLGPQGEALSVTNRAQVASDEVESISANNTTEAVTQVSVAADVGATMVDSPDPVAVGQTLTYDLVLTNRGPGFAYNVQLTNTLPPNVTFLSAVAPDGVCSYSNGIVSCALGILTPGSSTPVSIAVSPAAAGRLTNSARVSTVSIDVTSSNNLTSVVTDVALAPTILSQPQSRIVTNGANAIFSVSAGGTAPLSYQWQYNGIDRPGATNGSLTVSNAPYGARGDYRVRVSNLIGGLFSQAATLTVLVPPGISDLGDLQTDEDTPTAVVAFIVSDVDASPAALVLSAAVTEPGTGLPSLLVPTNQIFFGGSGSNRTVQILPGTNRFGSATITITTRDADGLAASDSFLLTVRPINDSPLLSDLLDRSMLEDGVLAIPFAMSDPETPSDLLSVSVVSSNAVLFPPGNVTLSGSGTNRLLILQPAANLSGSGAFRVTIADTNGPTTGGPLSTSREFVVTVAPVNDAPSLNQPGNLVINEDAGTTNVTLTGIGSGASNEVQTIRITASSDRPGLIPDPVVSYSSPAATGTLTFAPVANSNGMATIRVSVDDGSASNNVLVRTFTVSVSAVNDLPRISGLTDVVTAEDTPAGLLPFRIEDVETAATQLTLSYTSSDTNLVPQASGPAGQQAGLFFAGSGSNRTVQVFPATNLFGTAMITITVSDGDGGSASASFVLRVDAVNDAPTLGAIADVSIREDSVATVPVSVGDAETAAVDIALAVSSSNTNLIADSGISLSGPESGFPSNRVVSLRPVTNAFGSATITVTATDGGGPGGPLVATRSFLFTVSEVNDLPEVSVIPDQVIDENAATAALAFTVQDVESPAAALSVVPGSSNTNLVPVGNVVVSGTGTNRTVAVAPVANRFGVAGISLTVTDTNGGVTVRGFQLTVRQVTQPPVITGQPQTQSVTNGGTAVFSVSVGGTLPIFFQWRRNGIDLPGRTNASLSLTNVQASEAGSYSMMATNPAGQAVSAPASLRVLVPPRITAFTYSPQVSPGGPPPGGQAQISFSTAAGLSYTVEFKNTPVSPGWNPLGPVAGTGGVMTVTDPAATARSRIYRVRVE